MTKRRFIDLSITLDPDVITDPPFMRPTIERQGHAEAQRTHHEFDEGCRDEQDVQHECRDIPAFHPPPCHFSIVVVGGRA